MPQLNLKPMYPNILNNKMNKIFRNLLRLKMTYVTIDNKDNEPIFEILLVFQHLYPDKNMADMETNLVMVENFFDFLELRMTYSIRKKMNSFQRLWLILWWFIEIKTCFSFPWIGNRFIKKRKKNLRPNCVLLNSRSRAARRFSRCSSSACCRSNWLKSTRVVLPPNFSVVCWATIGAVADAYDGGCWAEEATAFACIGGLGYKKYKQFFWWKISDEHTFVDTVVFVNGLYSLSVCWFELE